MAEIILVGVVLTAIIGGIIKLAGRRIVRLIEFWQHERKEILDYLLQGENCKNRKLLSRRYFVRPIFTKPYLYNEHKKKKDKLLKLKAIERSIWKNGHNNKRLLLIQAEAGLGKTRLMLYLAYKLIVKEALKEILYTNEKRGEKVYYNKFARMTSIERLITDIKEKNNDAKGKLNYHRLKAVG